MFLGADSTVIILLAACLGLLVLLLAIVIGLKGRLVRIERLLASRENSSSATKSAEESVEIPAGGPFEAFLGEDPARRLLSKKEQSAAYRKWRQDRGMNWSNS